MTEKKRIEFIDLAKGICIINIVLGHCGVGISYPRPGTFSLELPMFFILSGLFISTKGNFKDYLIKRINSILIPFLFFYLIAYIPFYTIKFIKPTMYIGEANGILDLFNNRQYFNGPTWFLLALFWGNLLYFIVDRYITKTYLRVVSIIAIGALGALLGKFEVFMPFFIDAGITSLPFLFIGNWIAKTAIIQPSKFDKFNIPIALCCFAGAYYVACLSDNSYISFKCNAVRGNIFWAYICSLLSVFSVLFACKACRYMPIISYCGEYSLWLLCAHYLIYRPMQVVENQYNVNWGGWVVPTITIAICIALIPVCNKLIPWFIGKKQLINPK